MDDKLNIVISNEKEWRKYMIGRIDKLEKKIDSQQNKFYGLIILIISSIEIGKMFIK